MTTARPLCRECAVFRESKRGTSRATHFVVWSTGEPTMACKAHMERAIRGGGFGWPLPKNLVCDLDATPAMVKEQQQVASVARRAPVAARELEGGERFTITIDGPPGSHVDVVRKSKSRRSEGGQPGLV